MFSLKRCTKRPNPMSDLSSSVLAPFGLEIIGEIGECFLTMTVAKLQRTSCQISKRNRLPRLGGTAGGLLVRHIYIPPFTARCVRAIVDSGATHFKVRQRTYFTRL